MNRASTRLISSVIEFVSLNCIRDIVMISTYELLDAWRDTHIIASRGFVCETHKVVTPDGYILTMHRVVNPFMTQSASWVYQAPLNITNNPHHFENSYIRIGAPRL